MDANTLKIAAQYGIGGIIAALLVFVLGKILWKIGERMIAAIDTLRTSHEAESARQRQAHEDSANRIADRFDQLADRFDAHTHADVQALKSVQLSVANLDGKFDAVLDKLDRTPPLGTPLVGFEPGKVDASRWQIVTPEGAAYPIAECKGCGFKAFAGDKRCAKHEAECIGVSTQQHPPKRGRTNG